ncbi:hypothetical protein O0555_11945 [Brevibacillus laterosporus]|uniref:hypothetical protein n=1 Tax=Brevibacillus laterosporus TaxID=1465 RepID=UPI0018CC7F47|nr:hypothetical protein [Brevibacillus laterosporus]MBG9798000.1 hypothetical protein [Brevibacillus laterosporus]MCR8938060.1 hypothetical protein [Brevibacillus laterosporus]MCZ0840700.1 hypothetical protein [Brevibacillus laterosporus]MCZ0847707.1 hypothetical protein [Brevibacillus laterosporus]MED1911368.1 hypothetical protein [Brevibacillus laterosporus]
MAFKTSINIKLDIGNEEFFKRYIPTPSHAEAMKSIIDGFLNENENHAHMIVGPYGTGKSLLANIMCGIVSKMVRKDQVRSLINRFEQVDDYVASIIDAATNIETNYLPIILSGNEGGFRQSILSKVIKSLKEKGIDLTLPGLTTKILNSIDVWKREYPETYMAFCNKLDDDGKSIDKWIEQIKKHNRNEIKYFSNVYPLLTSGANFDIDYDNSFVSQIEYINTALQENNIGIIVVYDEFGRFLQGLNSTKFNETMQDIQDLAEISNRTKHIHLLFITHKGINQYFNGFNNDAIVEFQRIEQRFSRYFVQNDQATFLRLAEIIISENIDRKPIISSDDFKNMQQQLRRYPLFPSLNQTEREELVIQGMYPLHPISLFMLPSLTRVFGQNERTLFTFLESQETGGFINHLEKHNDYYLPHQLFDYFFPVFNDYSNEEVSEYIVLYKKAIARIPDNLRNKQLAFNVIKIITLWNICGLQNEQKLNTDFLTFVTNTTEVELNEILSVLSKSKVVRFNRVNNYWELFAGNSVDIYEKIDFEKQLLVVNDEERLKVLYKNLKTRFFLPEEYNDEKGMTRFAAVKLISSTDLMDGICLTTANVADITIYFVIPGAVSDFKKIEHILIENSLKKNVLFFFHSQPVNVIEEEIKSSLALESLKRNKMLVDEDKGVKEEIDILISECNYVISKYLSEVTEFKENNVWYVDGVETSFVDKVELNSLLSQKCYDLFKFTPIILNDSFNRNSISAQQRNAAITVVDRILEQPYEEQFGITGSGPEYAIYASIFKNNGHLDLNITQLDFSCINCEPYALLRLKLIQLLDSKPTGNFKDIINLFMDAPFGIRRPIIPILLVSLLRDRWNEFMLYSNDMFVPGLNGTKLFEIIEEAGPENYQYVYEHIDEKYIEFFNKIELHFEESLEKRLINNSRLIFVCGTLLKWLRSLPRFTQTSDQVKKDFLWFRECIKRSEIDPHQSIAQLFEKFHSDFSKLFLMKDYGEKHLDNIKKCLGEKIFETTALKSFEKLKEWVNEHNKRFVGSSNKFVKKLNLAIVENDEAFIQQFAEEYIGVKIQDWSDTTYNLFLTQITYDFKKTTEVSEVRQVCQDTDEQGVVTIQLNDSEKIISRVDLSIKSKTVYDNLERMIITAGRNVPRQELEFIIYKLFENHVVKRE